MPDTFHTTRRVEFHDTDMAGIMHFTSYYRFMEIAEHELLRSLGFSVVAEQQEISISWPRVSARCDFKHPAMFEQVLDLAVSIIRLGTKSVTYQFRFSHQGTDLALGEMTSVCCEIGPAGPPQPIAIPPSIREKLAPFVIR